ncbi:MAG: S1 RNA-binding domain-containing protein, partial [Smithellaceae bacterium]|nr:S1 RNA-binding domain-containing protein [Smithellaceae bacterium]
LLSYVSGLGESLAKAITRHRDEQGPFASRKGLMLVPRFGAKAFEQAAGFLRIRGAVHPLDDSAVHPENYALVETMAAHLAVSLSQLAGDAALAGGIDLDRYISETIGLPTLRDILAELKKPGRDPRAAFEAVAFRDDVQELADLQEGMVLPGTVTNVAAFGAFVDIGVHQDGLVHVSHLADRFIKDPNDAVKVGQIVKVKVLAVDLPRKRISLSIKEALEGTGKAKAVRPAEKITPAVDDHRAWEKAGFRVRKR